MYRRPLITLIACATLMASLILVSPAVAAQANKGKPPPHPNRLQPVSTGHPPGRFGIGDSQGSARGSRPLR